MDVAKFAKDIGITIFRFPGTASTGYHWKTGTYDFSDRFDNAPMAKIENLIKFCKIVGAKLALQVNIESGTPQEAAEWVHYMNKEKDYRVDYWELGGEVFGDWEVNHMRAEDYAQVIKVYVEAMKKAQPWKKKPAEQASFAHKPFLEENRDQYYRRLFDEYITSRQKLGQSNENIYYERFVEKLEKNENVLKARHGCAEVRFEVVVKEGKVVLKPVPKY